ncbi:putative Holliday junction resolvase [Tanacetum coccineum]|uniref:Holliday junction resolvase n=1 Tax=Tanacetum coccineum TaxID=301880 RepID=A0ABQ5GWG3_9ASTR
MRYAKPLSLYRDLLKPDASIQGRLLGLSIGPDTYRPNGVGVAVSEPPGDLAKPLWYELKTLIVTTLSVSGVIVGCPSETQLVLRDRVEQFVKDLSEKENFKMVRYTFWDEDDVYAKRMQCVVDPFSFDPIAAKKLRDKKYAASGMLQDYLDAMKNAVKKDVAELSQ